MDNVNTRSGSTRAGLATSLLLVFIFMAFSILQAIEALPDLLKERSTIGMTVGLKFFGSPLGTKILFFAFALLLVHVLWALAIFMVTRLTMLAFPQFFHRTVAVTSAWFLFSASLLVAFNARNFPWSKAGVPGVGALAIPLATTLILALSIVLFRVLRKRRHIMKWFPRVAVYATLAGAAWMIAGHSIANGTKRSLSASRMHPNVILIGIDSLRPDVVGGSRRIGLTPNIDRFLREAQEFTHSVTPLARTFPTWASILSGKYPVNSGARENLLPRRRLNIDRTLPEALRAMGYSTTFGIDETRFANIDEEFGFDTVIVPEMGVADWLLGTINDMPLTNLAANGKLGRILFPASHGNRAAAHVYEPETYVDMVNSDLKSLGPQFIALHLTLPHWPYHHAESATQYFMPADDSMYAYLSQVIAVDRQFGELMEVLDKKGLLENSIVVLLSDHGEAVNLPARDSLLAGMRFSSREDTKGLGISMAGHGNTVLSPSQYETVLAIRGYGETKVAPIRRRHDFLVSPVDLMPSLLELVGAPEIQNLDGRSFAAAMKSDFDESAFDERIVLTETGLVAVQVGLELDEEQIAQQADFYQMNPDNGRIEFRPEMLDRAVANKERAAISRQWTLVRIPPRGDFTRARYLAFDRENKIAFSLDPAKLEDVDGEVQRLASAMRDLYRGEVPELSQASQLGADARGAQP